jgi:hypothetical protein
VDASLVERMYVVGFVEGEYLVVGTDVVLREGMDGVSLLGEYFIYLVVGEVVGSSRLSVLMIIAENTLRRVQNNFKNVARNDLNMLL